MANLVVADFRGAPAIAKNCGWAINLHCTNADGSDFDLTPFSSFTFKLRRTPAYASSAPDLYATGVVTLASALGGLLTLGLAAVDTKSLPATGESFAATTPVWGELNGILTADPLNPVRLAAGSLQVSPGGNAEQSSGTAPTVPLQTLNVVVGGVSAAAARALIGLGSVQQSGITSTVTTGGTTTLTNASTQRQEFTGTLDQTLVLPAANTLDFVGWGFCVVNNSTGTITTQADGGGAITTVTPGMFANITCKSIATSAGTWLVETVPLATPSAPGVSSGTSMASLLAAAGLVPVDIYSHTCGVGETVVSIPCVGAQWAQLRLTIDSPGGAVANGGTIAISADGTGQGRDAVFYGGAGADPTGSDAYAVAVFWIYSRSSKIELWYTGLAGQEWSFEGVQHNIPVGSNFRAAWNAGWVPQWSNALVLTALGQTFQTGARIHLTGIVKP